MPNIRDIARACGVAPITVSAVLNNKSGKVSAATRDRILRVMREMDYRPGPAVRTVASKRRAILGVVTWPDNIWGNDYHRWVFEGVSRVAQQRHQHLLLFANYLWTQETQLSIRTYGDAHCDGMMIFPSQHEDPLRAALAERGLPFVVIGDTCAEENYASIDVDNVEAAQTATEHLLMLGHRRIAYLGGLESMRFSTLRAQGYAAALARAGLDINPAWMSQGRLSREEGLLRAQALLDLPRDRRPTALFCCNDELAYGALAALSERGVDVPKQMSVVGFDDESNAARADPPLTTLRQPYAEIGSQGVEILLEQIEGASPRQVVLPATLVTRASTMPPAA